MIFSFLFFFFAAFIILIYFFIQIVLNVYFSTRCIFAFVILYKISWYYSLQHNGNGFWDFIDSDLQTNIGKFFTAITWHSIEIDSYVKKKTSISVFIKLQGFVTIYWFSICICLMILISDRFASNDFIFQRVHLLWLKNLPIWLLL